MASRCCLARWMTDEISFICEIFKSLRIKNLSQPSEDDWPETKTPKPWECFLVQHGLLFFTRVRICCVNKSPLIYVIHNSLEIMRYICFSDERAERSGAKWKIYFLTLPPGQGKIEIDFPSGTPGASCIYVVSHIHNLHYNYIR